MITATITTFRTDRNVVMGQTKEEKNATCRAYRKRTCNADTKKYEKTKQGFLMRLYRNMTSRVTGSQKLKRHLYEGKELLPREDFYSWASASPTFHSLWEEWENNGHERRLAPSVDRIDSTRGYSVDNMEWVPFHENCRRGAVSRWAGKT